MEPKDWIALTSIVSALVLSLITLWIGNRREQRQERLRSEERAREHADRIEERKHEHEDRIREKQIELQYGKLQDKRVTVISELYSLLWDLDQKTRMFINALEVGHSGLLVKSSSMATDAVSHFDSFFSKNRLFFRRDLAEEIQGLTYIFNETHHLMFDVELGSRTEKATAEELKAHSEMADKFRHALDHLDEEFRQLMGT